MKLSTEIALPVLTYAWVFGLSLLSALATYFARLCKGETLPSPYLTFFLDIIYCQMAGLITYFLAVSAGTEGLLAAALVSAGSHMGARLIFAVEALVMHTIHLQENAKGED
ncbi:MAG: hypothetical protein ACXW1W_02775 [Methylococcaceae bacterium]